MQDSLYPSISPVNTFRLILGEELLPDRSYFSRWRGLRGLGPTARDLVDVTDILGEYSASRSPSGRTYGP